MTDDMLELARRNAAEAKSDPTSSSAKGRIESSRSSDASVDVVISNCVVNLSTDKAAVLAEVDARAAPGRPRRDQRRRRG